MKCTACKARLLAYHDGELNRGDVTLIAGHLAACPSCNAYSRTLAEVETKLLRVRPLEPAPDFTLALMAKIATLPAPQARRTRVWWLGIYMALAWSSVAGAFAFHLVGWQGLVADTGVLAGRLGVAGQALYHLGDHFHLTTFAALSLAAETIMLAAIAIVGRKYLARIGATFSGAQMP